MAIRSGMDGCSLGSGWSPDPTQCYRSAPSRSFVLDPELASPAVQGHRVGMSSSGDRPGRRRRGRSYAMPSHRVETPPIGARGVGPILLRLAAVLVLAALVASCGDPASSGGSGTTAAPAPP